jgi:hypothetical protein
MSLPWPSFWSHIPETDRAVIREILTELLSTGVLLGDDGRARQLYLVAREYQRELTEYLAPLSLDLLADPDRPLFQARPIPGECGLTGRFSKDETLLVLTLWRMYDEVRMERTTNTVIVTANEVFARLRLYFEKIEPPTETHFDRMISMLRSKRLIRIQRHEDPSRFGESVIEILPTLQRVIPFESLDAWEQQAALQRGPVEDKPQEPQP